MRRILNRSDLNCQFCFTGNISKNCTSNGWSDIFPDILSTCGYNDYEDDYKVGKILFLYI